MICPDGQDAQYHWERIKTPPVVEVPKPDEEPRYWTATTYEGNHQHPVLTSPTRDWPKFPGGDVVLKADYDLMRKTLLQQIRVLQMMQGESP